MSKATESSFFDHSYATDSRRSVGNVYSIVGNRCQSYERQIYEGVAGKRVLEYGCGPGSHFTLEMARRGAEIVGIDISQVGVEQARERARAAGLANASFEVMDAEEMTFADSSFDLVIGEGILHHLSLEKSYAEIARVLKPSGRAVFMEPLGHNPAIVVFRKFTPSLRTPDEHPLVKGDLALANRYFQSCRFEYHHLSSFAAIPFRKTPLFRPLIRALDGLDRVVFRAIPAAGLLAWYAIMVMEQPRK